MITLLLATALLAGGGAEAPPLSYDCDTAEGAFSQLKQVQPGPSYRITGRISAHRLRQHDRWVPVATVRADAADGTMEVALQLVAPHRPDGPLDVFLVTRAGKSEPEQKLLGHAEIGGELPFELAVDRGKVRARIGSLNGDAKASLGSGASVGVSCSTGEFLFNDLRLSR